jgi:hypothetical protein
LTCVFWAENAENKWDSLQKATGTSDFDHGKLEKIAYLIPKTATVAVSKKKKRGEPLFFFFGSEIETFVRSGHRR